MKFIGLIVSETRVTLLVVVSSLSLSLFFIFFLSFLVPVALLTAPVERNASFERRKVLEGLMVDEVCFVLF